MSRRITALTRTIAVTGALLAGLSLPMAAQALPSYSNLFVFGDSLADSGNNAIAFGGASTLTPTSPAFIPSDPYESGRYSNGPVWVEKLANDLGLSAMPSLAGGTNFAFGGARVATSASGIPSLVDQVSLYLGAPGVVVSPTALYVVEGGGNDARDILTAAAADIPAMIGAYAAGMVDIITTLKSAGAHDILLWNVPDVGKTPAIQALAAVDAGLPGLASGLVAAMNSALDTALNGLRASGLDSLYLFDAYGVFNDLFNYPSAYGFDDVLSSCSSSAACIENPLGVLFWDGIHPTTAGHTLLARLAAAEIPEPATFVLMLVALLLLAVGRSVSRVRQLVSRT